MVVKTVVQLECDPCAADGVETPAETFALAGQELEVCAEHAEYLEAAATLLTTYGRPAGTAPTAPLKTTKRGRPAAMTAQQARTARRLLDKGSTVTSVARQLGVSRSSVYKHAQVATDTENKTKARQPRKVKAAVTKPATGRRRFKCGDCGQELAQGSKTGHARGKHSKSARRVTWTKVE